MEPTITYIKKGNSIYLKKQVTKHLNAKPGDTLVVRTGKAGVNYVVLMSCSEVSDNGMFSELKDLFEKVDNDVMQFYISINKDLSKIIRRK
jgi:hypothetical protein